MRTRTAALVIVPAAMLSLAGGRLDGGFKAAGAFQEAPPSLTFRPGAAAAPTQGEATLRTHRGRGLATLAKLALLRWAGESGIETIWTANDETNAAMLAINQKLGYRPGARDIEAIREL